MKGITLILGSGGARGLCFIGALRALAAANIPICHIIGSSMGAIVGAAYASGTPLGEIETTLLNVKLRRLLRPSIGGPGVFSHTGLYTLAQSLLSVDKFDQLHVPLTVACTDLQTGMGIAFKTGELAPPVVGSSLLAGLFDPIPFEGRMIVDGGYTGPAPVTYHDHKSLAVVIDPTMPTSWRLDLASGRIAGVHRRPGHVWAQFLKSMDILMRELTIAQLAHFDCVHVVPELGSMKFIDFELGREAIKAGERAVSRSLPLITSRAAATAEIRLTGK